MKKNAGAASVTVCVKANNGCGTSAQRCSTMTLALQMAPLENGSGPTETAERNNIQFNYPMPTVFPNPAADFVNLKFDEIWYGTEVNAYLLNIEGKTIREFSFVPSGEEMQQTNVSGLMPGMYMIVLRAEGQSQSVRFIKQ